MPDLRPTEHFGSGSIEVHRSMSSLKANSRSGCLMCAKLLTWFKLDTPLWDGFNLGGVHGPEEVVFKMKAIVLGTLGITVSLAGASHVSGGLNYLYLQLLTTAGMCPSSQTEFLNC